MVAMESSSLHLELSTRMSSENGRAQDSERRERKRLKYRRKICSDEAGEDDQVSWSGDYSETIESELRHRLREPNENGGANKAIPSLSHYFPESIDRRLQLIIIGDRNVGKSSFLDRFTSDSFKEEAVPTVGIDFKRKVVSVGGLRIRLQIWDTAGQERFDSITTAYYRSVSGVLLIYDVTKPESYTNLPKWLDRVKQYAPSEAEVAIVGNKADLPEVKVNSSRARNFAEKSGYLFHEASAKANLNVETAFNTLIYKIIKQIPEPHERNPRVLRKVGVTTTNDAITRTKKTCC